MVGDVALAQLCVRQRRGGVDRSLRGGGVVVVPEIGCHRDEHGRRVGTAKLDVVADRPDRPAVVGDPQARLERRPARAALAAQHHVSAVGVAAAVELPMHVSAELELTSRDSLDVHDEDVVDGTGEVLAPHAAAPARVRDGDDPCLHVEVAPVVLDVLLVLAPEEQRHVGELLVRRLVVRHAEEGELGERVRLLRPPREQQPANLVQVGARVGIRPVGEARPEGLLVDLERLLVDAPEHHPAEAPVADRRGAEPPRGRAAPPQTGRRGRGG